MKEENYCPDMKMALRDELIYPIGKMIIPSLREKKYAEQLFIRHIHPITLTIHWKYISYCPFCGKELK